MTNPHNLIGPLLTLAMGLEGARRNALKHPSADNAHRLAAVERAVLDAAQAYGAECHDELDAAFEAGQEDVRENDGEGERDHDDQRNDLD